MPTLESITEAGGSLDRSILDKIRNNFTVLNAALTALGLTPTVHASSHQHGGADEVATATAAANAIPKAGAGTTLATGWIPDMGMVAGVAAGYKLARGTLTPDATPKTVVSGLATVVAVIVSLKGAPTMTHMWTQGDIGDQSGSPAAGSFLVTTTKPTAVDNVTPTAASTPWGAVDWVAIGT